MSTLASAADSRSATGARGRAGLIGGGRDVRGLVFQGLLLASLLFSLAILFVLVGTVLSQAAPVFGQRGADILTASLSSNPARTGVGQGIVGTVVLGLIVALVAFPFGVMTAVYLEEYAPDNRLTRFIQVNIRNLAGVPSVVYGLLGLSVFVALFDG